MLTKLYIRNTFDTCSPPPQVPTLLKNLFGDKGKVWVANKSSLENLY